MKVSIVLKDNNGNVFEGETDLTLRAPGTKGTVAKPTTANSSSREPSQPRTATEALRSLYEKKVFKIAREFNAVEQELAKVDCNFPKPALAKALGRADFLTRHGKRRGYRWIQKYPPGI